MEDPELMWSTFGFFTVGKSIFSPGCSFSIQSILENGLIPGGKESDKGRQTVCFSPLDPVDGDSDEEEHGDHYTVLKKVHHHSHWKRTQDAVSGGSNWKHDHDDVFWVELSRAQDQARITILADEITCNNRTQSCAGRLHLQSNLSERRWSTIRKTLNSTTCAEGDTREQLAIAAAAAATFSTRALVTSVTVSALHLRTLSL